MKTDAICLSDEALREALAALEHERWSGWEKWREQADSVDARARWKRQRVTPYAALTEREKESDRAEADKTLTLLRKYAPDPVEVRAEALADVLSVLRVVHDHVVCRRSRCTGDHPLGDQPICAAYNSLPPDIRALVEASNG